ncbi:DUF2393 family protein [Helicobacter kayseriensis]|uniref:DUF2393 family protein n=1 Tax=Helicobacter kayseriensis TaxID=2905877 RepID=UPI001E33861F|nr:DUF2393 family protein [Helicobacter kayseriensis]MCE3046696.1 DUF2393 domain-containing protein [Helicobacter kayseriensis]MCE3048002.1 DUF2393 domain-containing protein [Helicobacter kayseriensis]
MGSLNHWVHSAKEVIVDTFSLLSYFDLLVFGGCFLVFVLFYFLSCIFSRVRFFIPQILSILAYMVLLATPVIVFWINQNIFYKNRVEYIMAKRLEYSPTFYVDAKIYNQGKLKIGHCYFVLDVLRSSNTLKNQMLNMLLPYKRYKYKISQGIQVGESVTFQKTINQFPYQTYQMKINCYGGK